MPQPMVVASHLWASMVTESASSMPASIAAQSIRGTAPHRPRRHRRGTRGLACARWRRRRAIGSIMPAPVVPAVATIITGTTPCARSAAMARGQGVADPCGPGHRSRPDAAPPRPTPAWCAILSQAVALARGIERHRARRRRARRRRRIRDVQRGQRAEQRGVVGLRAAGGEMPARLRRQAGALRDGADHMPLDLHRHGRGSRARQLRIEGAGDAIGALRRKARRRIEQPEIARVASCARCRAPVRRWSSRQQFVERPRLGEIEGVRVPRETRAMSMVGMRPGPLERRSNARCSSPVSQSSTRSRCAACGNKAAEAAGSEFWFICLGSPASRPSRRPTASAWSRSARMSSMCSMPTLRRIVAGSRHPRPAAPPATSAGASSMPDDRRATSHRPDSPDA